MGPLEREQRQQLCALALAVMERVADIDSSGVVVTLKTHDADLSIKAASRPESATQAESILELLSRCFVAEDERRIILALGTGCMTAPAIGERLGISEGRLKTILALLHGRKVLRITDSGYEVAEHRLLNVLRN